MIARGANPEYLTFESVDGVGIAVADYRGCSPEQLLERLRVVRDWVVEQPPHSVVMMTLAAGVGYSPAGMRDLVTLLRETRPHMRASAVVGLAHLTLLIRLINHLAGRRLHAFEHPDEAKRWLLDSAAEIHD